MDFYAYQITVRKNLENHLFRYYQLFIQFFIDLFAKIENECQCYIQCNRLKLRVDKNIHLKNSFDKDENISNFGQKCILP